MPSYGWPEPKYRNREQRRARGEGARPPRLTPRRRRLARALRRLFGG
jgi:hypothetical protein